MTGSDLLIVSPLEMRNFAKFHLMSAPVLWVCRDMAKELWVCRNMAVGREVTAGFREPV